MRNIHIIDIVTHQRYSHQKGPRYLGHSNLESIQKKRNLVSIVLEKTDVCVCTNICLFWGFGGLSGNISQTVVRDLTSTSLQGMNSDIIFIIFLNIHILSPPLSVSEAFFWSYCLSRIWHPSILQLEEYGGLSMIKLQILESCDSD